MIKFKTVLVLGAGASIPYGLPSGQDLLDMICENLCQEHDSFCVHLRECDFSMEMMSEFGRRLALSELTSVDAFLEKNEEFLEVGKAAIARSLIPYEMASNLHRQKDDHWYKYLINQMDDAKEDFKDNALSIITFNYDRSLEHYLFVTLKNRYNVSDEETAELLKTIPIIHVHGQLANYPFLKTENARHYDTHVGKDAVKLCANEIKIIHEAQDSSPEFKLAQNLIEDSKRTFFLGFGYNQKNVQRLVGPLLPTYTQAKNFFGSAYDIREGERPRIRSFFKIELGSVNDKILDYLRNNQVFLH